MNNKSFAFIIVTYNDTKSTSELVDKLLSWDCAQSRLRIVIVDNCSTDNTFAVLQEKYGDTLCVDILHSDRNGGYGAGNNLGAKYAFEKYGVEYTAIANPDILIEEDVFLQLLIAFDIPEVAVSTAVMKNLDGSFSPFPRKIPEYRDDLRACFGKEMDPSKNEILFADNDRLFYYSDFIPGSFFVIRSRIFQDIGGFDENIFLFCEERVIGKKLKDAGYRQVIYKDHFFLHAHSVTIKKAYSVINTNRIMLKSRLYYNQQYSKVPLLKYCLLWLGTKVSIFGLWITLTTVGMYHKLQGR